MSLINDALKRAQEVQEATPPVLDTRTQYRPVEPQPSADPGRAWLPPIAAILLLTAAVVGGVHWLRSSPKLNREAPSQAERADEADKAPAAVASTPAPTATADQPDEPTQDTAPSMATAQPVVAAAPEPAPVSPQPTVVEPPPAAATPQPVSATDPTAGLKLQAIIAHPQRPSAIVNGKSLFVGDRLGGLQLVSVTVKSVTFSGSGREHVIRLAE
jgi:hypothetical protein